MNGKTKQRVAFWVGLPFILFLGGIIGGAITYGKAVGTQTLTVKHNAENIEKVEKRVEVVEVKASKNTEEISGMGAKVDIIYNWVLSKME